MPPDEVGRPAVITNKNATYALVAAAGVAIALFAGLPVYYLLLLACPVMMFFMMSSMSGGMGHGKDNSAAGHDQETKSEKTSSTP